MPKVHHDCQDEFWILILQKTERDNCIGCCDYDSEVLEDEIPKLLYSATAYATRANHCKCDYTRTEQSIQEWDRVG